MMQARPTLVQVERRAEEVRTPGPRWEGVRRLLVVRNDRLGDLVVTLPLIAALRATYRDAWIGLLVRASFSGLARLFGDVDEVLEDDGGTVGPAERIRTFRPDAVIAAAPGARLPWIAFRLGVRHRLGTGFRWYAPLFDRTVNEHRRAGVRHEVEHALAYAHRVGAAAGLASFHLQVPESADESLDRWLESQRITGPWVALHPGSGGSGPAWPMGHYLRLAALLRAEGRNVVFTLGPMDKPVDDALDAANPDARRLPRLRDQLPTLAAALRRASLVVSNSTGPMHLAAAVGAPVLSFHAPWASNGVARWGPYSQRGYGLVAALEEAESWSKSERALRAADLLATISPAVVLKCSLAVLEGREPRIA